MNRPWLAATLLLVTALAARAGDIPSEPRSLNSVAVPMRLTPALKSEKGFEAVEPWTAAFALRGGDRHAERELFSGAVHILMYESEDELIKLVKQPYDEFVYVIRGEAILTPEGHASQRFAPGDFFVVPKGFTGKWETRRHYRELVVIETKSDERANQYYFKGIPDPKENQPNP